MLFFLQGKYKWNKDKLKEKKVKINDSMYIGTIHIVLHPWDKQKILNSVFSLPRKCNKDHFSQKEQKKFQLNFKKYNFPNRENK